MNTKNSTASIGLFYGSSTCYTEMTANKILEHFPEGTIDIHNINETPANKLLDYDQLILGIPTWDYGELQEDWEAIWDDLDDINFTDKTVALYGQGDQIGYPDWFLDALGYLHNKVLLGGATIVGYWPNEGYEFKQSQALTEDKRYFVGLALDDEGQFEQSDERIRLWCQQLAEHFMI